MASYDEIYALYRNTKPVSELVPVVLHNTLAFVCLILGGLSLIFCASYNTSTKNGNFISNFITYLSIASCTSLFIGFGSLFFASAVGVYT